MYGIFNYIYPKNGPNVGKYSIHGASGHGFPMVFPLLFPPPTSPVSPSETTKLPLGTRVDRATDAKAYIAWRCTDGKNGDFWWNFTMENWVKIGKFGEFYHGKLEKHGKCWWDFTMENWKKMGNFGGILPWKIGKNWEHVRLFCRMFENLRKNGELQDFTMENEGIEVFHYGNKRFHLKFKHTRP